MDNIKIEWQGGFVDPIQKAKEAGVLMCKFCGTPIYITISKITGFWWWKKEERCCPGCFELIQGVGPRGEHGQMG